MTTPKRPVGRPRKVPVEGTVQMPVTTSLAAPPQLRVTISKRVRRGEDPVEEEVAWPRGWPLPDAGAIVLGKELGGWVSHCEMDLVNDRIIVVLRAA